MAQPKIETIEPMETLPDFLEDAMYSIKVSRAVEIAPNLWVRPDSPKCTVSGEKAQELGDAVIWAVKV